MQSFVLSSLIGGAFLAPTLALSADRLVECRVPFEWNDATVDMQFVDDCIKNLKLTAQDNLQVIGSATPEGSSAHNAALARRRAENLQKAFASRMPRLKIRATAVGEIPKRGLLARAVAREKAPAPAVASQSPRRPAAPTTGTLGTTSPVISTSAPRMTGTGSWRVGPRMGRDRTAIEEKDQYLAPGLDFAYVPTMTNPYLYAELGGTANIYSEVDNQRMRSVHFAPTLAYRSPSYGLIAGARGLVGLVHSTITQSDLGDGGAELRLGKETAHWSAFLGVGRTRVLAQRVGLDLGFKF